MEKEIQFFSEEKVRLDDFLRANLPQKIKESFSDEKNKIEDISNSKIRRLILAGAVHVNKKPVLRPAFELRGRSFICVRFDFEKFFFEKQPDDAPFELSVADILFEDENLIFLNKPPRFPVEQTITGNRKNLHDSLVDFLWRRNPALRNPPYAGIMHRLDRETSGVILFTKSRAVNAAVSEIFQSHNLIKQYFAVVEEKKSGSGLDGRDKGSSSNSKFCNAGGRAGGFSVNLSVGQTFSVKMFMGRVSGKSVQGNGANFQKAAAVSFRTQILRFFAVFRWKAVPACFWNAIFILAAHIRFGFIFQVLAFQF